MLNVTLALGGQGDGVGVGDRPVLDAPEPPDAPRRGEPVDDAVEERGGDVPSYEEYRAAVDAEYRRYAVEQGCARVREVEEQVVTPAMRRIEAADPERRLVGLDHRLKGEDRLTEKVVNAMSEQPDLSYQDAFATVKDAIRFTLTYPRDHYADGLRADHERLKSEGFELVDRRNTWDSEQYKGVNTRWRVPESGQIFEVQFHTEASFEAKQETHWAYEKLRAPGTTKAEQDELTQYQRRVASHVPVPPGATDIESYP